jgi:hypothetical protein
VIVIGGIAVKSTASNQFSKSRLAIAFLLSLALALSLLTASTPALATNPGTPTISNLSVARGTAGDTVVITGTRFYGMTEAVDSKPKVYFRGTEATAVTLTSSTSLTVTVPTGSGGYADVSVETMYGTVLLKNAFLYRGELRVPIIDSVAPKVSTLSANQEVTLVGSRFVDITAVKFGTQNAASYRVESDKKIVATVPSGIQAGSVRVTVENAAGPSTSIINLRYAEACDVGRFGNVKFAYRSSELSKEAKVSIRKLTTSLVKSECGSITLLRYNSKLTASSSSAHRAYVALQKARATEVEKIVSKRLAALGSTAKVRFAKLPKQASQTAVTDWDSKKEYRRVIFAYRTVSVPAITNSYPTMGTTSGGEIVTLKGINFEDATSVKFGNTTAEFVATADDTILVTTPSKSAGDVSISVTTPDGTTVKPAAFKFVGEVEVNSLSATSASVAGYVSSGVTTIVISGKNFIGLTNYDDVLIGGVRASYYKVDSATQITATVPVNSVGTKDVAVTSAGGGDELFASFTYRSAPSITSVGRSGAELTISGANFEGTVRIGFEDDSSINRRAKSGATSSTLKIDVPDSGVATGDSISVRVSGIEVDGTATLKDAVPAP